MGKKYSVRIDGFFHLSIFVYIFLLFSFTISFACSLLLFLLGGSESSFSLLFIAMALIFLFWSDLPLLDTFYLLSFFDQSLPLTF